MKNFIFILIAALSSSSAYALVDVDVVVDAAMIKLHDSSVSTSAKLGLGAGALVAFDFFSDTSFETGIILENRVTEVKFSGALLESQMRYFKIPLALKYSVLPMLSLRGGLYYAKLRGGSIPTKVTFNGTVIFDENVAIASSDRINHDYGALAGVSLKLPLGIVHGVVNANYLFGLNDVDSSKDVSKFRGFELQFGLGMGI